MSIWPLAIFSQEFTVYSVIGEVRVIENNVKNVLAPKKMLKATSGIVIAKESALTLLDEHNGMMYSFTEVGQNTVGELVRQKKYSSKNLSRQYMNYLVKQLFTSGSSKMMHPNSYMQATASAYRSETRDSMLLSKIIENIRTVNTVNLNPEKALADPQTLLGSDMNVSFELISYDTGKPLDNNVKPNTSCYVRAHNGTDKMLYMNILNIDEHGNKYLVLPIDSAITCSHLLVPPMAMVSFKSEPIIFGEIKSNEAFLLVATEEPLDFSILMAPIRSSGDCNIKAGLYRLFHKVE